MNFLRLTLLTLVLASTALYAKDSKSSKNKQCRKTSNLVSCLEVEGRKRDSFCWKKRKMKKLSEKRKESLCKRERKKSKVKKTAKVEKKATNV